MKIGYLLTHICKSLVNICGELVEAVEKYSNVAIIYCSDHNVGDDFELTGKEFNDSAVDVSSLE